MAYLPPLPNELQKVEFVKLYFHLQTSHSFHLPHLGLLQLRREMFQAFRTLSGWGESEETRSIKALLQPELSSDPILRRQVQKPAPAFVLFPDAQIQGEIKAGQIILLPALFVGRGVQYVNAFAALLKQVGQQGLYHGTGQFVLEGVESEDGSGVRSMLWQGGRSEPITAPINDLHWWLEKQLEVKESLQLEVISPLRILSKKRPLFKADLCDIMPYVLRRITSVLASHAGVDVIAEVKDYLDTAKKISVEGKKILWKDWRQISGDNKSQDLGGLMGTLDLQGPDIADILWLLQLASIFNLGKGAPYGCGQIRLRTTR